MAGSRINVKKGSRSKLAKPRVECSFSLFMESLKHFELGEPFPNSPHAVASNLPTMADVCGYEEKDPRVMRALASGYPRFVVHEYIRRLLEHFFQQHHLKGRFGVLVPSKRAMRDLVEPFGALVAVLEVATDIFLLHCDLADEPLSNRLRKHLQHKGYGLSSRQAEDLLVEVVGGVDRFQEESYQGNALNALETGTANLAGCGAKDVLLCASGMSAFYAAFRSVQEFQRSRRRSKWLQLGWLYLDSGCILKEFLYEDESLEYCYDVLDTERILKEIYGAGDELAAVVVECPTNPLAQVCELETISNAVSECGGVLIIDPTIASIYSTKYLAYADLLVTSLTKYAAYQGDVMAGALFVNPNSKFYGDLIARTSHFYAPLYLRDAARLAIEMRGAPPVIRKMRVNATALAQFLSEHDAVKKVWFAKAEGEDELVSAIITIELKGSLSSFYDKISVVKGPSFGTFFTLLSPFMYLAHYDLVTAEAGRGFLEEVGLNPELIRISVGAEPLDQLLQILDQALRCEA
ncbi:MAG: PLP-dependent transferase [Verrucomicrobiota bacterium]